MVDDEENIGRSLRLILEREGYAVNLCSSIAEAKAFPQRPDVYLLDVKLADGTGIDLLRWFKSNDNDTPVIMISGHGTIADAVEATRAGAFDFLEKPLAGSASYWLCGTRWMNPSCAKRIAGCGNCWAARA